MLIRAWRVNRHTGAIRGPDDAVYEALHQVDVDWRWNALECAYLVNLRRFDAVLVALERNGHRVDYQAALW